MTDKQLRQLSRTQLLELLLDQINENDRLREENERLRDLARVSCRFNNGRASELRNYNIINGVSVHQSLDKSVKNRPSVWQWCNTEKLDV